MNLPAPSLSPDCLPEGAGACHAENVTTVWHLAYYPIFNWKIHPASLTLTSLDCGTQFESGFVMPDSTILLRRQRPFFHSTKTPHAGKTQEGIRPRLGFALRTFWEIPRPVGVRGGFRNFNYDFDPLRFLA